MSLKNWREERAGSAFLNTFARTFGVRPNKGNPILYKLVDANTEAWDGAQSPYSIKSIGHIFVDGRSRMAQLRTSRRRIPKTWFEHQVDAAVNAASKCFASYRPSINFKFRWTRQGERACIKNDWTAVIPIHYHRTAAVLHAQYKLGTTYWLLNANKVGHDEELDCNFWSILTQNADSNERGKLPRLNPIKHLYLLGHATSGVHAMHHDFRKAREAYLRASTRELGKLLSSAA